jgi:hypothetical protein
MSDHFCNRCGGYLPEGSIRYTVHIQILSDFDGLILYQGEDVAEEAYKICNDFEEVEDPDPETDMFQELSFVLCENCKNKFAQDPFNRGAGHLKTRTNIERMFH